MELNNVKKVHFIGIGGIGMSALAKYFLFKGVQVSGYDKVETKLTHQLSIEGAFIDYKDDLNYFPSISDVDLVIYTPAISEGNKQFKYFKENQFPIFKRAKILGLITNHYNTIAIAGTHGKTTTSSIAAHILHHANKSGVAFLGGITTNYDSNILLSKNNIAVVEADEYDRSFLELNPDTIVLTSMDADHLDIYKEKISVQDSFIEFTELIKNKNNLIIEESLKEDFYNCLTYGFSANSDLQIANISIRENTYLFDFKYHDKIYKGFSFKLPGRYNLLNAAGAAYSCILNGVTFNEIKNGLASFKGVKRRFEIHFESPKYTFIDDYAHHPKEIEVLISAIRDFYPNRKIIGLFQPHLYTRTRDFISDFADSLAKLDDLILFPIYPAREKPIKGVSSKVLFDQIKLRNKTLLNEREMVLENLTLVSPSVVVTIGAGDIDLHIEEIKNYIIQHV
jgi:UDP-N-acetylmuramate--alanine ligase